MDRRLIDYLPPVLREIEEFKAINGAMQPEIESAWAELEKIMNNQFLSTADKNGVARWEKELGIFPKDTDTLETRKARIKAMWNRELPYTLTWLGNWLTSICGSDGHTESVSDYTINVRIDYSTIPQSDELVQEILEMLKNMSPQNMVVQFTAFLQSNGYILCGANTVSIRKRLKATVKSDDVSVYTVSSNNFLGCRVTAFSKRIRIRTQLTLI